MSHAVGILCVSYVGSSHKPSLAASICHVSFMPETGTCVARALIQHASGIRTQDPQNVQNVAMQARSSQDVYARILSNMIFPFIQGPSCVQRKDHGISASC